jgi:hypothetical protein
MAECLQHPARSEIWKGYLSCTLLCNYICWWFECDHSHLEQVPTYSASPCTTLSAHSLKKNLYHNNRHSQCGHCMCSKICCLLALFFPSELQRVVLWWSIAIASPCNASCKLWLGWSTCRAGDNRHFLPNILTVKNHRIPKTTSITKDTLYVPQEKGGLSHPQTSQLFCYPVNKQLSRGFRVSFTPCLLWLGKANSQKSSKVTWEGQLQCSKYRKTRMLFTDQEMR